MSGERDQIKIKINGKDKQLNDTSTNNEEIAAGIAPSNKDDEFEWILPEQNRKSPVYENHERYEDDFYYAPRVNPTYSKKKRKLNHRKPPKRNQFNIMVPKAVIISIISAIIIGVGLGLAVLMVFTDDKVDTPVSDPTPAEKPSKDNSAEKGVAASFLLDFSIVQGGVYSTVENANKAVGDFQNQKIPAAVDEANGKYYVLIGVAGNEQIAEQIESKYKSEGLTDAYAKPWSFKAEEIALPAGLDKDWILKGEELLTQLISANGQAFLGSLNEETPNKVVADYQAWVEKKPKDLVKSSEEISSQIDNFIKALDDGIKSLSSSNVINGQQKTLNAYTAYSSLVSTLAK